MDLAGNTIPFLTGEGHAGIVMASRAMIAVTFPLLFQQMEIHKDYPVTVVGYSLGAGIAQLLALELRIGQSQNLNLNNNITFLAYGSPPVYTSRQSIPVINNLLHIQHADDFMSGLSLRTVTDLLDRLRAIEHLNLRRRTLLKIALTSETTDNFLWGIYNKILLESDEEEKARAKIKEVVENIPEGFSPYLHHLGKDFLVLRKTQSTAQPSVEASLFTGFNGTTHFSKQLQLHPSMIND